MRAMSVESPTGGTTMKRTLWLRWLAGMSVLGLLAAGCGSGEVDEPPEAADADDADGDDASEEQADASATSDDEAVEDGEEDDATSEEGADAGDDLAEPEEVTAYVVGYHWGWALFDEDGTELEQLEVPVGSEVELVAVNDHASHAIEQLPGPVVGSIESMDWHERAVEDLEQGQPEGLEDELDQAGMSLSEAITVAHDGSAEADPTPDHELMVTGLGVDTFLEAHADAPERLVFTADEEGTYEFRCLAECGVGHEAQRLEMLVVTG